MDCLQKQRTDHVLIDVEHEDRVPVALVSVESPDTEMALRALERTGEIILVEPKDMNPDTGKIEVFETDQALANAQAERIAEGKKPLIPLDQFPDPKCKKCYGRGHLGKDLKTGTMIPCKCVKKANKQTKVQGKQLSAAW